MTQSYNLLPRVGSSMAEEWLEIGLNHHIANRFAEAEQAYSKGLRIDPNNGPILVNLGVMAAQQGAMLPAIQRLERAILFIDTENKQQASVAWYDYALALLEAERADEAIAAINTSIEFGESDSAYSAKGMILTSCGLAAEAVDVYDKALAINPKHPMASYNALFARTLKNTTPKDNFEARKRWYENNRPEGLGPLAPHINEKVPDRPLRVGYVGGDFKMHSAAFIFGAVILQHDRSAVEPFCYMTMSSNPAADATTKAFMEKTTWRDISAMDDSAAERLVREDKIDILVDLSGHTGGNRLTLFMRKPAPIQVHAWGFAHGSGCPEIDYFFADPYAIPAEEREFFAEKIWNLPAIVGYSPPQYNQPLSSTPPVANNGVFTFGVFGRFEKFSPQSLEAWHKILLRTPSSRLILKDLIMRRPYAIRRIRDVMHDIDPKRILFMQDSSHPEHMLAYQGVDLVLDTFPHTGGVTALEILHMGVPIITLYNGQVGGRTTSVALAAIKRQKWIASSIDEYVRKAVNLAEQRIEVAEARKSLSEELRKSPLCSDYVKSVEHAYRQMWWRRYCGHDVTVPRDTGTDVAVADNNRVRHS